MLDQYSIRSFLSSRSLHTIIRYGICGVSGGILQVFFLHVLVDKVGLWYMHGVVIAFLASLVIVFLLQKFWTFQDYSTQSFQRQSVLYFIIALLALTLNIVSMYILVDVCGVQHIIAQAMVVLMVGGITFLLNKTYTFKKGNEQS